MDLSVIERAWLMFGAQEMFADPMMLYSRIPVLPHDLKVLICLNHEKNIHGLTAVLNFLCVRMMSRNTASIVLVTRFFERNLENISTSFLLKNNFNSSIPRSAL